MPAPDALPPLFDAHLDPTGLTDADLEALRYFGLASAVLVVDGQPSATARGLIQAFDRLVQVQLPRFRRAGIRAFAALGVAPNDLPRRGLAAVLSELPSRFRGLAVAVGETGLAGGGPAEEEAFLRQVTLAKGLGLPLVVHTPRQDRALHTRRVLSLLRSSGLPPARVLVNHVEPKTVRTVLECGHFAGLTVHPDELPAEAAVALVRRHGAERLVLNTGHGGGEILALARVAARLAAAGLSARVIARVTHDNAANLYRVADEGR